MRVTTLLLLSGLTLIAPGCARKSSAADVAPDDRGNTEIAITIQNHHWSDVRIYLLHDGISERLGLVTAASTHNFFVPYRRLGASGQMRLQADPVAGRSVFTSELITIQPGQAVTWTLETTLSRSSVMVF